jgi:hypothetical protein
MEKELEAAIDNYVNNNKAFGPVSYVKGEAFRAGAKWQNEQEHAELAAANKRIKELDDMYLKLSQKYADLYEKRK